MVLNLTVYVRIIISLFNSTKPDEILVFRIFLTKNHILADITENRQIGQNRQILRHCDAMHGIFVLFWYVWKEEIHSYSYQITILRPLFFSGFNNTLVSQVTKNSLSRELTAHDWQQWKGVFLTYLCHEIYRDEAVGLKSCNLKNYDWCEYVEFWGNFVKIWFFVNNWHA